MTHISYSVASFSIMRVLTRCREGALYKNIQTTKATPWRLFLNSYVLKSRTVRFQVVRFLRTQTHESLTLMFRLHKETLDMLFAEILCYSLGDQESWQLRRCAHQVSPSTVTVMCTSSSWVLFSCAALPCSVLSVHIAQHQHLFIS
ncbi:uncharacterized protein [Physcomitrium patens]|uniref:uncharacterized protein isoform X4 n=1 Tax=Physcomitrium patens TaxID=3218 RepID=UPI000D17CD2F|nr:uncharacterized protein LOC112287457 isoform X4 [Physcomitrium patens]|eukprot:XP_024386229.1 uncharacterized protein LOC112287457 isoform X4 [Physcomitrella patens]